MKAVPIDQKMKSHLDRLAFGIYKSHGTERPRMVQLAWVVAISSGNILHAVKCLANGALWFVIASNGR